MSVWNCNTILYPKLVDQFATISCEEEEEEEEEAPVSCSVAIRFVDTQFFLTLSSGIWDARISALISARSGLLHSAENVKPLIVIFPAKWQRVASYSRVNRNDSFPRLFLGWRYRRRRR